MVRRSVLLAVVVAALVVATEARPAAEENKSAFGSTFDEIVVESTLTVRGKGGASRQSRGKKLEVVKKPEENPQEEKTKEVKPEAFISTDGASVQLSRPKRQQNFNRRQRPHHQGFGGQRPNFGGQNLGGQGFNGQRFPSGSASSANAASQGFNVAGPNGFGASASNAGTQGFQFGPNGVSGSAAQSASQVYRLPNGNSINVAFSNGFSAGPNGGSRTGANSVTVTGPDGRPQQQFRG